MVTKIANVVDGRAVPAASGRTFEKISPVNGRVLSQVAASAREDVDAAVAAARRAQPDWARRTPVERGECLFAVARGMRDRRDDLARVVSSETGKSMKDARGETDGAIALAEFMAGEGRRLYGRTLTSAVPNKAVFTIRQPLGVAGLIVAANTPVANVAWKVFPALVCGNTAVLKAPEDAPGTADLVAAIAHLAGLPPGVLNVVQGDGLDAGAPLVAHDDVAVVSFTGSTAVGREVAASPAGGWRASPSSWAARIRLSSVTIADLTPRCGWPPCPAFSNAVGAARPAAGSSCSIRSRRFRRALDRTRALHVGPSDDDRSG
jgi:aldehyde dehydrogenase (NAD+)